MDVTGVKRPESRSPIAQLKSTAQAGATENAAAPACRVPAYWTFHPELTLTTRLIQSRLLLGPEPTSEGWLLPEL